MKYRKADINKSFNGYIGPGDELLNLKAKNSTELRESWDVWGPKGHDEKEFPNFEVPTFKTVIDDVKNELENAAKKIIRSIEIYLQLEEGFFLSKHKNLGDHSIKTQTVLRSLFYNTLTANGNLPPNSIRCGEHSDYGTITLLMQDMVGGLEVKTSDGEWIDATPVDNAILLNSGQLLEYWSGGLFHAALHRVRIRNEEILVKEPRQSCIYFINPDSDVNVFPLISVLPGKEGTFQKFNNKPINAYNHFQRMVEYAHSY